MSETIQVIDDLHDIKHRQMPVADAVEVLSSVESAVTGLGIKPIFLNTPTFYDSAESKHPYGVAFAISKFDEGFLEHPKPGTFRYRDDDVQKALKAVIAKHGLAPLIRWDRGGNMFIFNLYFADRGDSAGGGR